MLTNPDSGVVVQDARRSRSGRFVVAAELVRAARRSDRRRRAASARPCELLHVRSHLAAAERTVQPDRDRLARAAPIARTLRSVCPDRVRPERSVIVPEIISGVSVTPVVGCVSASGGPDRGLRVECVEDRSRSGAGRRHPRRARRSGRGRPRPALGTSVRGVPDRPPVVTATGSRWSARSRRRRTAREPSTSHRELVDRGLAGEPRGGDVELGGRAPGRRAPYSRCATGVDENVLVVMMLAPASEVAAMEVAERSSGRVRAEEVVVSGERGAGWSANRSAAQVVLAEPAPLELAPARSVEDEDAVGRQAS